MSIHVRAARSLPVVGMATTDIDPGLVNLRDLGGLPVASGGLTRHGMLYRSDAPHEGDVDPMHVAGWPPSFVVDLRMEREAERTGYSWPEQTVVCPHPLHEAAAPENVRDADLAALYRFILDEVPDRVATAVAQVVRATPPTLVHCTAGKDRTGIVVAALLLAAGVSPDVVVEDYVRTAENMEAVVRRIRRRARKADRPVNPAWLLAPEEAIRPVVTRMYESPHGETRDWLAAHGTPAEHLDAWVERFVSPRRPRRS